MMPYSLFPESKLRMCFTARNWIFNPAFAMTNSDLWIESRWPIRTILILKIKHYILYINNSKYVIKISPSKQSNFETLFKYAIFGFSI